MNSILHLYKFGNDLTQTDRALYPSCDVGNYRLYLQYVNRDGGTVWGFVSGTPRYDRHTPGLLWLLDDLQIFSATTRDSCGPILLSYRPNGYRHMSSEYTLQSILNMVNDDSRIQYDAIEIHPRSASPDMPTHA